MGNSPEDRKSLFQEIEENPRLLEMMRRSREMKEIRASVFGLATAIQTGRINDELCQAEALQMLQLEAAIPGTLEPFYESLMALVKEHGVAKGAAIAQRRYAHHTFRVFYHTAKLLKSLHTTK